MTLVALVLGLALQGTPQGQTPPSPTSPAAAALAEADAAIKKNDNQAALSALDRAITLDPKNAQAYLQKCRVLAGVRRHADAIPACTDAIRLEPDNPDALRDRGHYYLNLGRFDEGLADLRKAESLNSRDRGIYYHLGMAYYLKGDFASAARAFKSCLDNSPDDATRVEAQAWLYPSLRRAGREADAKALLDSVHLTSLPGHPGNYLDRLLLFNGVKTEQQVAPTMAEEDGLSEASVGYSIGLWHLLSGRADKAREYFKRAIASGYAPAWGYRASEVELRRMQ